MPPKFALGTDLFSSGRSSIKRFVGLSVGLSVRYSKKISSGTNLNIIVPAFKDKLLSGHNVSEAPGGHNTKQHTLNTSLHATTETIQN